MSKDIKAGTWWVNVDGDIVYVGLNEAKLPIDVDSDKLTLCCYPRSKDGIVKVVWYSEDQLVRELPGCTGFDYKEPPAIPTPGDHPTQWVPMMGVDGQVYHCLGYPVPNR